jgi:prophage maintenance system killer protein
MAKLFETERSVITKHIHNIFRTKELRKSSVCAKFAHTAQDGKTYQTNFYNLDMIISVGYRVNSKRGTQFRIWATNVLRQHLVEGYTLNKKRLEAQEEKVRELQKAIDMLGQVVSKKALSSGETGELIRIIKDYSYGLNLLDAYDKQELGITGVSKQKAQPLSYSEALDAIKQLRDQYEAPELFGREKDDSFQGSLVSVFQTFEGKDLYPSIEEKAANLLYFLVRNHPFVDGNKRIAAFMFLWFLDINGYLYEAGGGQRLANNALVALTLMVAESKPFHKDVMIKLIINLINKNN